MSRRGWRLALHIAACVVVCTAVLTAVEPGSRTTGEVRQLLYMGRYADAEWLARELLPEMERAVGPDSLETAALLDSLVEALWRGGKSSLPETRELAERAFTLREARLGDRDLLVADSLVREADVLLALNRDPEAGELLTRALQIYESAPGSHDIRVSRVHNRLGKRYLHTGPTRDAEWHSALAVGIAESASPRDELALAEMLTGLAEFHLHSLSEGYRTTAEPLARQALEIRRRILGEEHPLVADSLYLYGWLLHEFHLYEDSAELIRAAIDTLERSVGPDHPRIAHYLYCLHHLQQTLGDPVAAEESLWNSIAIFEEYPEIGLAALSYGGLADLRHRQGDLVSARQLYEKALGITERTFGPGCIEAASLLNNLGQLQIELGELEDARRHLERGLKIATELYGNESEHTAVYDISLSDLYLGTGDLEVAEVFARRACESLDCSKAASRPGSDAAARALGAVLREEGRYEEARELLDRALTAWRGETNALNHDLAENLIAMGDLLVATGDDERAVRRYEEALTTLEGLYGAQHPRAAAIRLQIADCRISTADWEEAFDQTRRAEDIAREQARLMLTGMSERVGLRYAATRPSGLDRMLSLLIDRPDSGTRDAGVEAILRARALVLDEIADRGRAFSTSAGIGDARLLRDLTQSRQRLAYLTVQGPGAPDALPAFQRALANARRERDRAERVLAEANRRFRLRQRGQGAGLTDVLVALPPSSGLVGFSRYRHLPLSAGPGSEPSIAEPTLSYLAYVLRTDTEEIGLFDLGSADEIDRLVEQLRAEVEREAQATVGDSAPREAAYREVGERLRGRVWDPIRSHLDSLEQVFVAPAGSLHLINLAALPVGERAYLEEVAPRLHYLSAERDLLEDARQEGGTGLLAMGNPDFDAVTRLSDTADEDHEAVAQDSTDDSDLTGNYRGLRSTCASFQTMQFAPLPASEAEVRNVVGFWRDVESEESVFELFGPKALEVRFKRLASGRRVLHLSTHGFYLGEDCPAYDVPGLHEPAGELESPLLRSGLAFAGANHRESARPDGDDGILTAEEVAAVDLLGVEWAVLSACESGLGEVQTGEGVFGLRRAFAAAGVRTLIMSLWPVDDDVTREWMDRLYRYRFVEGATTIVAVHRANLDLLAARRASGSSTHPFYWAGFVAVGDWR